MRCARRADGHMAAGQLGLVENARVHRLFPRSALRLECARQMCHAGQARAQRSRSAAWRRRSPPQSRTRQTLILLYLSDLSRPFAERALWRHRGNSGSAEMPLRNAGSAVAAMSQICGSRPRRESATDSASQHHRQHEESARPTTHEQRQIAVIGRVLLDRRCGCRRHKIASATAIIIEEGARAETTHADRELPDVGNAGSRT